MKNQIKENRIEYLRERYCKDNKFYNIVNLFRDGIEKKVYTLKDIKEAVKYIEILLTFGLK